MNQEAFLWILAFAINFLVTDLLESIFLIEYNGRYKLRFHSGNLNPFISREKTLLIYIFQGLGAALLSIPLGTYFEYFVKVNSFYYVPLLSLTIIAFIILGVRHLKITMSKDLWTVVIFFGIIFFGSLYLLTGGDVNELHPINLVNKT